MFKVKVRATLLALFLPFFLHAAHVLNPELLKPEASKLIEEMGNELFAKTGIQGYVVTTNDALPRGTSMVEYVKRFESKVSKPYIIFVFAPHDKRVGLVPSNEALTALYDAGDVKSAAIDIVAVKDKNTLEDKYNIGIVQAFSELADQIADAKGIKLTSTIPNDTRTFMFVLKIIILFGSSLVLWMFILRPLYMRIKNGKK